MSTDSAILTWLDAFKQAWQRKDVEQVLVLFTDDVEYWETPIYRVPDREALKAAWKGIYNQRHINITCKVLGDTQGLYIVQYDLTYMARHLCQRLSKGLYLIKLNADGQCTYFYQVGEDSLEGGNSKISHWARMQEEVDAQCVVDNENVFFAEREVWWCAIGVNVGYEQNGAGARYARPVVILRKHNQHTCLVVPLTTGGKDTPDYYDIGFVDGKQARANLSQIRLIDRRRLLDKLGMVSEEIFGSLQEAIQAKNFPSPNDEGEAEARK